MQSASELHRRLQKLIQTTQLALQRWHQAQVSFSGRLLLPTMFTVRIAQHDWPAGKPDWGSDAAGLLVRERTSAFSELDLLPML